MLSVSSGKAPVIDPNGRFTIRPFLQGANVEAGKDTDRGQMKGQTLNKRLHGAAQQLTSTNALWDVCKCWAGPVVSSSFFDQDDRIKSDLQREFLVRAQATEPLITKT